MCKTRSNRFSRTNAAFFIMMLLGGLVVPQGRSQTEPSGDQPLNVREGEVVIELKPGASIEAVNARYNTTIIQRIYGTNFYRLRVPANKRAKKWRKKLSRDVEVLSASLNQVVTSPLNVFARATFGFPDGFAKPGFSRTDFVSQPDLKRLLNLGAAQEHATGAGVIVAIVDTGIDKTHPDLAARLWGDDRSGGEILDGIDNDSDGLVDDVAGWDFVSDDRDPSEVRDDPDTTVAGHGTFIAGLISLVAPGARIMPVRAFPPNGVSDAFTVAQGIKFAVDHGAQVINLSFGSDEVLGVPGILFEAVQYAHSRGAVLVSAVGNENTHAHPQFPATSNTTLAVAATDLSNQKAPFSNYGPEVDVSAPGTKIFSTYPGKQQGEADYATWSGTSFAAPFVAAEAALLLEILTRPIEARRLIEGTCEDIGSQNPGLDGMLGRGRINPGKAVNGALLGTDTQTADELIIVLSSLLPDIPATGKAKIETSDTKQELEVEGHRLSARLQYTLRVNGAEIAADIVTNSLGDFKIQFSNESGSANPLPFTPITNVRRIELLDNLGRIVLRGDYSTGGIKSPAEVTMKHAILSPTAARPGAGGAAELESNNEREKLKLRAAGLAVNTPYRLFVDNINLGLVTSAINPTDGDSSSLRAEFTSDASSGRGLPPEVLPITRIRHVELRDLQGNVILAGDFRAASGSGDGGGGDGQTPQEFEGTIERLPSNTLRGEWIVSGQLVRVLDSTVIDQERGAVRIGARVEVKGFRQLDGSTVAVEIEVKSGSSVRAPGPN